MCAGAASSGEIAETVPPQGSRSCCYQPGSGGAPVSGHPETGRKLGTHGLQTGKAVVAAPGQGSLLLRRDAPMLPGARVATLSSSQLGARS